MITTHHYILDEDMFDPKSYRNYKFSKICQFVKSPTNKPYITKVFHLNKKGQIDRIEKIGQAWKAYPPGHEPPIPTMNVIDYLTYDEDKITQITTRPKADDKIIIGKKEYLYEDDQLSQIKNTTTENDVRKAWLTSYKYANAHLDKIEVSEEKDDEMNLVGTTKFYWNKKDQIFKKVSTDLFKFADQPEVTADVVTIYAYHDNNQLASAITTHKMETETIETETKFKYLNAVSNQLTEIEQFLDGQLLTSRKFSIDENRNMITLRIIVQNSQSVLEFKGYE